MLDYGLVIALVELAEVWYIVAVIIGALLGAVASFWLCTHWVFAAHRAGIAGELKGQGSKFAGIYLVGMVLFVGAVYGLTDGLDVHYLSAKILSGSIVFAIWNYPMQRRFVFTVPDTKKAVTTKEDGPSKPRASRKRADGDGEKRGEPVPGHVPAAKAQNGRRLQSDVPDDDLRVGQRSPDGHPEAGTPGPGPVPHEVSGAEEVPRPDEVLPVHEVSRADEVSQGDNGSDVLQNARTGVRRTTGRPVRPVRKAPRPSRDLRMPKR